MESEESTTATMTADDFVTGILAGLATRGFVDLDVTDRAFDRAMGAVYDRLVEESPSAALDIDFQVSPDPIHGDSVVIREALSVAVQGRIVSRVNPTFRRLHINLSTERAERMLSRLPGGRTVYERSTDSFLEVYGKV